jgi:hypothetical protein
MNTVVEVLLGLGTGYAVADIVCRAWDFLLKSKKQRRGVQS